ncbi:hypothetical protein EVAR_90305_1 [Eumeta japonica]|uniref:Uncharacterized protein n=1 Tax=Eumeta variegata TaxID=151549 RepID=A0A4C1ZN26_EUMVA|nr:hypothetical protein EVAR_90305_1 [Eumeta japonica]
MERALRPPRRRRGGSSPDSARPPRISSYNLCQIWGLHFKSSAMACGMLVLLTAVVSEMTMARTEGLTFS